jgi:hypothetical protein
MRGFMNLYKVPIITLTNAGNYVPSPSTARSEHVKGSWNEISVAQLRISVP